jgi:hypothetical protein
MLQTMKITDFKEEAKLLGMAHRAVPWSIGDLILQGEEELGQKVWQYVDVFEIAQTHLQDFTYIARRFPADHDARNMASSLSLWHFREVAGLDDDTAISLLRQALDNRWSTKELRRRKCELRQLRLSSRS